MAADGSGLTLLADAGSQPAWSPDGTRIAFLGASNQQGNVQISVVQPDGSGLTQLASVDGFSDYANGPVWSLDGTRITFIACGAVGQTGCDIYVVDADGSALRNLTNSAADDREPAWSPDGARIAFTSCSQSCGVHVIEADGSGLTLLADGSSFPAWSPDGTRIAFNGDGGIYVMNADGTGVTRVAEDGYNPAWQPRP